MTKKNKQPGFISRSRKLMYCDL